MSILLSRVGPLRPARRGSGLARDAREAEGRALYPNVAADPDLVREFVRLFVPGPVWILGAGLARASVAEFVGEYESWIKQPDGLVELFKRNVAIAPGGIPMGFEIVSSHYGGLSHSWVCNDFPKTLGTPLNVHGLVESYADVERTLAAVEADPGKEEGIWRAWLVTRYV